MQNKTCWRSSRHES